MRAAIDTLDRGDDLTMRSVAEQLGAKPMSLYAHIRDREDLLSGVAEAVLAEVELPNAARWQDFFDEASRNARTVLLRHHGAIHHVLRRPAAAGGSQWGRLAGAAIAALQDAGLTAQQAVFAFRGFVGLVMGLVLNETQAVALPPFDTEGDPRWEAVAEEFATPDFDRSFDAAIATFVAGIEARLAGGQRGSTTGESPPNR